MEQLWKKVLPVSGIPEDSTLRIEVSGEPVCLYNLRGRVYATHDTCTHAGASLSDGWIQGENIECPYHNGQFHIPTGKAAISPCTKDLKVFPVKVEGDVIYIRPV